MIFLSSAFFKIIFFEKFVQEYHLSVKQIGSRSGPNLIWIQTVCKAYQQMTLGGKELTKKIFFCEQKKKFSKILNIYRIYGWFSSLISYFDSSFTVKLFFICFKKTEYSLSNDTARKLNIINPKSAKKKNASENVVC